MKRSPTDHTFGGYHTDLKLSAVEKYLKAFTTALGKRAGSAAKFELWYIDAFAGTGYRTVDHPATPPSLFGDETRPAGKELRRGSAQIALDVTPKFDFLIFIEKRSDFATELDELSARNPQRRIQIVRNDANQAILSLIENNEWRSKRAVLFLDPYGMEVAWSTLAAIAQTRAIDVWYLFPLAGFFRQMPKLHSKLDDQKRRALNRLFGTTSWEDEFYSPPINVKSLDGSETTTRLRRQAKTSDYEKYAKSRLQTIFGSVLDPMRLPLNGTTRYLLFLCISSQNPRAIEVATRIGSHILRTGISS
jgi:three-Cys-motif partner protein